MIKSTEQLLAILKTSNIRTIAHTRSTNEQFTNPPKSHTTVLVAILVYEYYMVYEYNLKVDNVVYVVSLASRV